MSLLNEWIMENLGIDMKSWEQKLTKSQKKENSTFREPNGMLGNITVSIIEFQYSNNNNISNNKMIYNKEIADHINNEAFSINLQILCYGEEYLEEIKKLQTLIREESASSAVIPLYYAGTNEYYFPLAITSLNFSNNSKSRYFQKISLQLKEVKIYKTLNDYSDKLTTNTLNKEEFFQNKNLTKFEIPANLKEEIQKSSVYKKLEGGVNNVIQNIFRV